MRRPTYGEEKKCQRKIGRGERVVVRTYTYADSDSQICLRLLLVYGAPLMERNWGVLESARIHTAERARSLSVVCMTCCHGKCHTYVLVIVQSSVMCVLRGVLATYGRSWQRCLHPLQTLVDNGLSTYIRLVTLWSMVYTLCSHSANVVLERAQHYVKYDIVCSLRVPAAYTFMYALVRTWFLVTFA